MSLMNYLPQYYAESDEVKALQSDFGLASEALKDDLKALIDQLNVSTATWGLGYWEEYLGIKKPTTTFESRREVILSTLRGFGTTTKEMIKNMSAAFSGGEVEVIEDNPNYRFVIKFTGTKGVPPNMTGLTAAIERAKPAHLAFEFEYTYLTWDKHDSYGYTWDQWDGLNLTWDMLEVYDD